MASTSIYCFACGDDIVKGRRRVLSTRSSETVLTPLTHILRLAYNEEVENGERISEESSHVLQVIRSNSDNSVCISCFKALTKHESNMKELISKGRKAINKTRFTLFTCAIYTYNYS